MQNLDNAEDIVHGPTVIIGVKIPDPWPVTETVEISSHKGIKANLWFTKYGNIKAQIFSESLNDFVHAESSRIVVRGVGSLFMMVTLRMNIEQTALEILLNGVENKRSDPVKRVRRTLAPPYWASQPIEEKVSTDRLRRRRQQARDIKAKGKTPEIFRKEFERENRLLQNALSRLKGGNADEIVTISVQLRKLIGEAIGQGLLQKFGGFNDVSLYVWAAPPPPPKAWTPKEMDVELTSMPFRRFSSVSDEYHPLKMDIDSWLEREDCCINGQWFTNQSLIWNIGSKIGAHLDLNPSIIIDGFESLQLRDFDFLTSYLAGVAEDVVQLGGRILNEIDTASGKNGSV